MAVLTIVAGLLFGVWLRQRVIGARASALARKGSPPVDAQGRLTVTPTSRRERRRLQAWRAEIKVRGQ